MRLIYTMLATALVAANPAAAQQTVPADLEMAPYLPLGDEGLCRLEHRGEELLAPLLSYQEKRGTWTATGGLPLPDGRTATPRVENTPIAEVEGAERIVSRTNLPSGTTWHGLPLLSIEIGHIAVPESDDSDWRTMTFDVPAPVLRARMRALGQDFPMAPLYREIPGGDDRCDGAASIEADGARSRLTCGWGC